MTNLSAKILAVIIAVWFGGMVVSDIFNIHILNATLKIAIVSVLFLLLFFAIGFDLADHIRRERLQKKLTKSIFG